MTGAKAPCITSNPFLDDANDHGEGARKTVYGPRPRVILLATPTTWTHTCHPYNKIVKARCGQPSAEQWLGRGCPQTPTRTPEVRAQQRGT